MVDPTKSRMHLRLVAVTLLVMVAISACGGQAADTGPSRQGRDVYGSVCSACHGNAGQGGVGPSLSGVVETFPSCEEQVKWITLGSERWKAEIGPTYGANDTPVENVMPEMAAQLSSQAIAAVAAFERSNYGGASVATAEADCGFTPDGWVGFGP